MYFFKKGFKRILINKKSPGTWEILELQLQGKHGSGSGLQLQLRVPAKKYSVMFQKHKVLRRNKSLLIIIPTENE